MVCWQGRPGFGPGYDVGSIPTRGAGGKDTGRLASFYLVRRGSIPLPPTHVSLTGGESQSDKLVEAGFDSLSVYAAVTDWIGDRLQSESKRVRFPSAVPPLERIVRVF